MEGVGHKINYDIIKKWDQITETIWVRVPPLYRLGDDMCHEQIYSSSPDPENIAPSIRSAMLPWSGWSKPAHWGCEWRTQNREFVLCALSAELRARVLQSCCLLATEYPSMQNQCVCCSLEGNQVCACRAGEQAKLSHKAGVVCNKTLVDPCPSFVRHKNPEHRRQTTMEHKVLLIKTFFILPGSQCQTWLNFDSTESQVVLISLFTLRIVEAYFLPQHQFVYYKFPNPTTKVFVGQKLKVGMSVKLNSHFTNPLPSMTLEKAFPSSKTHSSLCHH